MTLSAGQVSFNGLTMGTGTDFGIVAIKGLRGLPPLRGTDPNRAHQDGAYPGWSFMAPRIVTMTIDIVPANASLETDFESLATAFAPISYPGNILPFEFMLSSSWSDARLLNCRPTKADPVWDFPASVSATYTQFDIELTAPDPLVYDSNYQTVTLTNHGSGTLGPNNCVNAGNYNTWPVITVTAEGSGTISVNGGSQMSWSGAMGSSSPWVFNMQNQTITGSGSTGDQTSAMVAGSTWPSLPPGTNTVEVTGSPGTGVGCTVGFASAWAFA